MTKNLTPLAFALALAGSVAGVHAAGTVTLTPPVSQLQSGQTVDLVLSGQAFSDNVVGGGLSLSWDPAVLDLVNVTMDAVTWEFARSPGVLNAAAGTLSDMFFASFKAVLPTGNFPIATLRFVADGAGSTDIHMVSSDSQPFASDLAEIIAVNYLDARVNVSAVPEPAAWVMFALGVPLLPALRRRLQA